MNPTCTKAKFPTRRSAKKEAKRRTPIAGTKLTVYRCKICEGEHWHLTSCNHIDRRTLREMNIKDNE